MKQFSVRSESLPPRGREEPGDLFISFPGGWYATPPVGGCMTIYDASREPVMRVKREPGRPWEIDQKTQSRLAAKLSPDEQDEILTGVNEKVMGKKMFSLGSLEVFVDSTEGKNRLILSTGGKKLGILVHMSAAGWVEELHTDDHPKQFFIDLNKCIAHLNNDYPNGTASIKS